MNPEASTLRPAECRCVDKTKPHAPLCPANPRTMLTAGGGYGPRHTTTRQFAPTSWALEMLAEYNALIRVNRSEDWDTVRAVAYCEDGLYGAFGELCELVEELSGEPTSGVEDNILRPLFKAYQSALRVEIVTTEGDR